LKIAPSWMANFGDATSPVTVDCAANRTISVAISRPSSVPSTVISRADTAPSTRPSASTVTSLLPARTSPVTMPPIAIGSPE
jgi:hypothetical protein